MRERGPDWSYRPYDRAPGVTTPQLDHLALAAYDVAPAHDPREVLRAWDAALPRADAVTVTVGLGPDLFERPALRAQRPLALRPLPPFPGDALDPAWCGGELCLQVCADRREDADETLAAVEAAAEPALRRRWLQHGERNGGRDVLGFRHGTMNLRRPRDHDRHVFVGRGERTWMTGGTFLVVRRIEVDLDAWHALPEEEQERIVGRRRANGGPLHGGAEFDPTPLTGPDAVAPDAHVRQAAPRTNAGAAMLRRAYSYERGLVFLAYVRDPRRQFVPVQQRVAEDDALARFSTPVGSAVFALPARLALT